MPPGDGHLIDWGFIRFQLGYGSAVAVILFAICLVVALAASASCCAAISTGALTTGP